MAKGIPRREIEELAKRWTLAKLPCLLVEGPSDVRMLKLIQRQGTLGAAFGAVDIYPIEVVNVPAFLVAKYGFAGTGAKQRLVSFGKEIEVFGHAAGFRCVADKDLDPFLGVDHSSIVVRYTDGSCMEAYSWNAAHLSSLIETFWCEDAISPADLAALFDSINLACQAVCAVRIVSHRNSHWQLTLHESDQVLKIANKQLELDVLGYVERCRPIRGSLDDAKAAVVAAQEEIRGVDAGSLLNGHDLVWLLTFVLRACTRLPRNSVNSELVATAISALGARDPSLRAKPTFGALCSWAAV